MKKSSNTYRIEEDALGSVQVPKEAYYGSFTARAQTNFKISGVTAPDYFRVALGKVKQAACQANAQLKQMGQKEAKAIDQAAQEFIAGKFNSEFTLDVFQAGAGTPYNMNANEVIANRANEILGSPKGSYKPVNPNNHVNMAQSSNDVTPTAVRVSVLMAFQDLKQEIKLTQAALKKKGRAFQSLLKIGRTHLEDAVPVTLGQEFTAYASTLETALALLKEAEASLCVIGLGGTATGTGINTHPRYAKTVAQKLSQLTGFKLRTAPNLIETTHSMAVFLKASSALRSLAVEVNRIANDLRLLNMGPNGGIAEIVLPEVEPGSSIMPGKVNPSVAECMNMICFQVIGNDQAVSLGAQGGQLELNWFTPLILHNLLFSCQIMTNGLKMFREDCLNGIIANKTQIQKLFDHSLVTATALAPYLGYHQVAMLVNEGLKKHKPIRELVLEKGLMEEKDLDRVLSPEATIKPGLVDQKLMHKLQH